MRTFVIELGTGVDLHGQDPTRAAVKAVRDAFAHVSLPGLRQVAEIQDLGTLARTLLQNVQVLSAGQNLQRDPDGKPVTVQVVNLLVTPDEAEQLSLAQNEAKIQLVLRNPLDEEKVETSGTATAYLFSQRPNRPLPGAGQQQPGPQGQQSAARVRRAAPAPPKPPAMQQVVVIGKRQA